MANLLYVTCNVRPQDKSRTLSLGYEFLDEYLRRNPRERERCADSGSSSLASHSPGLARGASNFDLPAQFHDPIRGNAEELGRIQGKVAQEDEQPIPPCQKNK